eukprot:11268451-Karenia_brevis.AAC.1
MARLAQWDASSEASTVGSFSIAYLLTQPYVSEKALRHVTGKYCYGAIFNRPLFSVLQNTLALLNSERMSKAGGAVAPGASVRMEMTMVIGILPFAASDLRLPFSSTLWATDASMKGGGIVKATLGME